MGSMLKRLIFAFVCLSLSRVGSVLPCVRQALTLISEHIPLIREMLTPGRRCLSPLNLRVSGLCNLS